MPRVADQSLPLQDWCVLSLRPRGQHAGLRAAAARCGASTLALSPVSIEARDDRATRTALAQAMRADLVLYTSPNAVAMAASLQALEHERGQPVLAVGSSTRRALRRLGIDARAPRRMDSEGLLEMPELRDVAGRRIALVTGASGRDALAPALRQRGAEVFRIEVYARVPVPFSASALEKLQSALADPERVLLALTSLEALQHTLRGLPEALRARFMQTAVIAASERLADAARDAGFRRIAIASDARPAALLRAAHLQFAHAEHL